MRVQRESGYLDRDGLEALLVVLDRLLVTQLVV
jgi:hypothetical protein